MTDLTKLYEDLLATLDKPRSNKFTDIQKVHLLLLVKSWHMRSHKDIQNVMKLLVDGVPPKTGKSTKILNYLERVKKNNINQILDIGGGDGKITKDVASNLGAEYYIDDPKSENRTKIEGIKEGSIDLIMCLMVLHHIAPAARLEVVTKMSNVLAQDGIIIIQEHDYTHKTDMYMGLDLLHWYWYVNNKETFDALYLMNHYELDMLMYTAGFVPTYRSSPFGWQRTYWTVYKKGVYKKDMIVHPLSEITSIIYSIEDSMYLTSNLIESSKTSVKVPETSQVQSNFIAEVNFLLTMWDTDEVDKVTVVFVNPVKYLHVDLLRSMFKNVIWAIPNTIDGNSNKTNIVKYDRTGKKVTYDGLIHPLLYVIDLNTKYKEKNLFHLQVYNQLESLILLKKDKDDDNYIRGNLMLSCYSNFPTIYLIPIKNDQGEYTTISEKEYPYFKYYMAHNNSRVERDFDEKCLNHVIDKYLASKHNTGVSKEQLMSRIRKLIAL